MPNSNLLNCDPLKALVRPYPGLPQAGILFYDITTLY